MSLRARNKMFKLSIALLVLLATCVTADEATTTQPESSDETTPPPLPRIVPRHDAEVQTRPRVFSSANGGGVPRLVSRFPAHSRLCSCANWAMCARLGRAEVSFCQRRCVGELASLSRNASASAIACFGEVQAEMEIGTNCLRKATADLYAAD